MRIQISTIFKYPEVNMRLQAAVNGIKRDSLQQVEQDISFLFGYIGALLDHKLISNKDWNEISEYVNAEVAKAKQEANL